MVDAAFSDFPLVRRAALAPATVVHFGPMTLESVPAVILQVLGKPGEAAPTVRAGFDLRSAGPGQWFAVGAADQPLPAFDAGVYGVDQSHGRVLIRLQGASVRSVLAKGTAIDLHPDQFAIGTAATTLIGHIAVNLCRTGEDVFELLVLRGFAESLWHELETMCAEFN